MSPTLFAHLANSLLEESLHPIKVTEKMRKQSRRPDLYRIILISFYLFPLKQHETTDRCAFGKEYFKPSTVSQQTALSIASK